MALSMQIFERFTRASFQTGSVHDDTINKLKNYDCKRNLSPMIFKGNQMVYGICEIRK